MVTMDKVIEAYVHTRDEIKVLEESIKALKVYQTKREEYLKAEMQKLGIENVKTAVGTAYTTTTESVTVADQEVFFNYVKDNEAWELMEKRASKAAVLAVMGERDESGSRPDAPPPGISFYAVKSINVRR